MLYSNLVTVLALSLPLGNHDERRKDAIKAFTVNEGFEEVFDTMCFRHILSRQASTRTGARQHRRGGTGDAGAGPPASGKTLHPASSSPQEAKPSRDVRIFMARADMDASSCTASAAACSATCGFASLISACRDRSSIAALRHARTAARYRWTFSGIGVSRAP